MPPPPRPARPDELADAFRLLFRHLDRADRDARVARALGLLQAGELDPNGVLVLHEAGRLTGALACTPLAGAAALVFPPAVAADGGREEREDLLVRHASAWLRGQGVKLAQALLGPGEERLGALLARNGFDPITDLWYLRHDLALPPALLATPVRLAFEPYDAAAPEEFHQTLLRTYDGTLDCPEMGGARDVDEVIAGHRAQGRYDPDTWWLARAAGRPVGVLIVAEVPESGDWEVAYAGVVPEARRRGFGREVVLKALAEARLAGAPRVTLSVDARNVPAWELYRGMGFEPVERRAVFLAVWR